MSGLKTVGGQYVPKKSIDLIKENLVDKEARYLMLFCNGEHISEFLDNELRQSDCHYIFGSPFPDDQNEESSFLYLNDIMLYIRKGNKIILKNMESIYNALFNLFNQSFTIK